MSDPVIISVTNSKLGSAGLQASFPVSTYSHESKLEGGFWSASFKVDRMTDSDMLHWAENGIGSHVQAEIQGGIVWEGLVDSMGFTLGSLNLTIGSMMQMSNKVAIRYQDIDTPFGLPIGDIPNTSQFSEDLASIDLYGELEILLSGGQAEQTLAEAARDTYLSYNAWPVYDRQVNVGGEPGERSITVNCVGYARIMERRHYVNLSSGFVDISDKIVDILDNTSFLETPHSVQSNTLQVPEEDSDYSTLIDAVKNVVSAGDSTGTQRYYFYVDVGRKGVYKSIDSEPQYIVTEQGELLSKGGALAAHPALVRPGVRVSYTDIFAKMLEAHTTNIGDDRNPVIESVSYTYPRTLNITTRRTSRLEAMLRAYGLGGL